MYAYSSILAALLQRQKTGRGQHLDISMLESLVEWMNYPLYYAYDGAPPPACAGASHATIYPYGLFPAAMARRCCWGFRTNGNGPPSARCAAAGLASEERFSSNFGAMRRGTSCGSSSRLSPP